MQLHYGFDDLKEMDLSSVLPIVLPVVAVVLILILIALIDLYRNKSRRKNIILWTCVILLVIPLGPILYLILGRKDNNNNEIRN